MASVFRILRPYRLSPRQAQPTSPAPAPQIWTRAYLALCLAVFLSYAHQGLLAPSIPLHVAGLGGSELVVGLVLATFSLSSVMTRPFIGYWADNWSVLGVLAVGTLLIALSGLALLVPVLWVLCIVNAVRGIGWAALNTGGYTLVAHIAPPSRRGTASGYYTLFQSTPRDFFPPVALWLAGTAGGRFDAVFLLSGAMGLAATLLARSIPRDVVRPPAPPADGNRLSPFSLSDLYDPGVLLASVLYTFMTLSQPAAIAFVPLYARQIGIGAENTTWYFIASGLTALLARPTLGTISDRVGRGPSIVAGFVSSMLGLYMLLNASGLGMLVAAGAVYAVGQAINAAAIMALAIDMADPHRRGASMATYSLANQLGQGLGAALWGLVIELAGYTGMYLGAMATIALGIVLSVASWKRLGKR